MLLKLSSEEPVVAGFPLNSQSVVLLLMISTQLVPRDSYLAGQCGVPGESPLSHTWMSLQCQIAVKVS